MAVDRLAIRHVIAQLAWMSQERQAMP